MSIRGASISLDHGRDTLTGVHVELLSEGPTEGRSAPWFARWDVPQNRNALRFIEMLLTDDCTGRLVLDDRRRADFDCAYDGKALLMRGLHAFSSA